MRRTRAGQTDHDDGCGDLDVADLGVARPEVHDAQAVRRVADAVAEEEHAAEPGALAVRVHLGQLHPEALAEVVGPEVVQPRAGGGDVAHGIDAQLGVRGLPELDAHALHLGEDGMGQVVDVDVLGHSVSPQSAR